MSKVIEKGDYVRHDGRPEYGVGRVIAVEVFSTRVLFSSGGLRVFRAGDTIRLKVVATPPAEELAQLEGKVALLGRPTMPAAVAAPKARRAAKKKVAPAS